MDVYTLTINFNYDYKFCLSFLFLWTKFYSQSFNFKKRESRNNGEAATKDLIIVQIKENKFS